MMTTKTNSGVGDYGDSIIRPSPQAMAMSALREEDDMSWEMHRLETFYKWPRKYDHPTPTALAAAGFYCTEGVNTVCFSCDGRVSSWTAEMVPDEVHKELFPRCPLVNGNEPRHKPFGVPLEELQEALRILGASDNDIFISNNREVVQHPENPHGMSTPMIVSPPQPNRAPTREQDAPEQAATTASSASSIDYDDMRFEVSRLRTLSSWPKPNAVRPDEIARAGMYFTGPGDRLQCAFCRGKLEGWIQGDDPLEEHRKHFGSRCPLFLGTMTGNVPIVQGDNPAQTPQPSEGPVTAPRFPEYAAFQSRLDSFNGWRSLLQTAQALANAGFFFTNTADTVKCHSCGGALMDWAREDDPWVEHARWYPKCSFVRQVKGVEFVNASIERSQRDGSGRDQEDNTPGATSSDTGAVEGSGEGKSNAQKPKRQPTVDISEDALKGMTEDEQLRLLGVELERLEGQRSCKVCHDEPADMVFLPCGHLLCCSMCAPALSKCPICRTAIEDVVQTYKA